MSISVLLGRIGVLEKQCVEVQKKAAVQVHALEVSTAQLGSALERAQSELKEKDQEILSLQGQLRAALGAKDAVLAQLRLKEDELDQEVLKGGYLQGDLVAIQQKGDAEIVRLQRALEGKTRERNEMAQVLHGTEDLLAQERMRKGLEEQNWEGERKEWEETRDECEEMLVRLTIERSALGSQVEQQADALQRAGLDNGDLQRQLTQTQSRLEEQTRALAQKDVNDEEQRLLAKIREIEKGRWWLVIRSFVSKQARVRLKEERETVQRLQVGLKR